MEATNAITAHSYWLNQNGYMKAADITTHHAVVNNTGTITAGNIALTSTGNIVNEGTFSSTGDMLLDARNNSTISNYSLIKAGGTLTMNAKKVINSGRGCGWLGFNTCDVGTLSANKVDSQLPHSYASNMGGYQYFKSTEINTVK